MSRQYTKKAVEELLSALERQAREVLKLGTVAEQGLRHNAFGDYVAFREKVSEFEVFSMIIEHRIAEMGGEGHDELQEKLDQLNALILSHLIGASIRFFDMMSGGRLPLGSRDIFISELKSLYSARERLSKTRYHGAITEEATNNLRLAEKILSEIIDIAPGLLTLG